MPFEGSDVPLIKWGLLQNRSNFSQIPFIITDFLAANQIVDIADIRVRTIITSYYHIGPIYYQIFLQQTRLLILQTLELGRL